MSIKATRALFPYEVEVTTIDEEGRLVSYGDVIDREEYDDIPFMNDVTMTAAEWVEQYGDTYLTDYISAGETAEIEIRFFETFEEKSYHDALYTSTCRVDSDLNVIESDDDEEQEEQEAPKQEAKANRPVLVCLVKKWGEDDYEIDFDDSMDSDPLFTALEYKHMNDGSSVRGSLKDIIDELNGYVSDSEE